MIKPLTFLRNIHSRLTEILRKIDQGEELSPDEDDFLEKDEVYDLYKGVATEEDEND